MLKNTVLSSTPFNNCHPFCRWHLQQTADRNPFSLHGSVLYMHNYFKTHYNVVTQLVKNLPAMQETLVWFLGWEDPLGKGYATYSSVLGLPLWLSWRRIHQQCRRPGFDPSVGKIPWRRERLPTLVFWPGEFPGLYSPCSLKELDTTSDFPFNSLQPFKVCNSVALKTVTVATITI